jgi:hypothetical protein
MSLSYLSKNPGNLSIPAVQHLRHARVPASVRGRKAATQTPLCCARSNRPGQRNRRHGATTAGLRGNIVVGVVQFTPGRHQRPQVMQMAGWSTW